MIIKPPRSRHTKIKQGGNFGVLDMLDSRRVLPQAPNVLGSIHPTRQVPYRQVPDTEQTVANPLTHPPAHIPTHAYDGLPQHPCANNGIKRDSRVDKHGAAQSQSRCSCSCQPSQLATRLLTLPRSHKFAPICQRPK